MKKAAKIISIKSMIFLFILTILAILTFSLILNMVSCGNSSSDNNQNNNADPNSPPDGQANDAAVEGETQDPRLSIKEDIPDLDFNGTTFNILYPTWSMYNDYYFAESEIGEKMNDAIYRRTKKYRGAFQHNFQSHD